MVEDRTEPLLMKAFHAMQAGRSGDANALVEKHKALFAFTGNLAGAKQQNFERFSLVDPSKRFTTSGFTSGGR